MPGSTAGETPAATPLATDDLETEADIPEHSHQVQPEREQHFGPAGLCDIAEVNDVPPAQAFQQGHDFRLGLRIIAAHQHRRVAPFRRLNHHFAVHDVERLDDFRRRQRLLDFFTQRVRVAYGERWRHALGKIQWIAHVHDHFAGHRRADGAHNLERDLALETDEDDFTGTRRVGERSLRRVRAAGFDPFGCAFIVCGARTHFHLVAELRELRAQRFPDHSCSENSYFHSSFVQIGRDALLRVQTDPQVRPAVELSVSFTLSTDFIAGTLPHNDEPTSRHLFVTRLLESDSKTRSQLSRGNQL